MQNSPRCRSIPWLRVSSGIGRKVIAGTECTVRATWYESPYWARSSLEIGEQDEDLPRVDGWAAGQWLTCDDNMAHVPGPGGVSSSTGFGWSQPEALRRPSSAFLQWGPATDNVLAHMFRDGPAW